MPPFRSEALSYDSIGRPGTRVITTDQQYSIDYAYNNQGALDTLTYPMSTPGTRVKVKYGYDYGILKSVTDWTQGSAGTVYWTANAQNVRGQTTQETLGNSVVTSRNFDAVTGQLNAIQSGVGGGTGLQNQSYLYDLVGNVTQRQESTQGLTENFYYDNLYRLDYSRLNGTTNLDLTYDEMGNITRRTDVNGNAAWAYHGSKKHAVANTGSEEYSFSYDDNGNMVSRNGQSISWSSFNYPTALAAGSETTMFSYGPDRQYYRQIYSGPGGTETTHYVGGVLEKVFDGTTTDWRHSIVADGQTVAIVSRKSNGANAVNYPLEDAQGSGSTLTSSSGTNLARQSYNAFGLPRDGTDWDGPVAAGDQSTINGISRRGYTGHGMLGAMGLIHMNGRVQDAITGRFLSPDPNVPDPGFTQSFNRYSYVRNNPLSFIDPSGFAETGMRPEVAAQYLQACGAPELYAAPIPEDLCLQWSERLFQVLDREAERYVSPFMQELQENARQDQVVVLEIPCSLGTPQCVVPSSGSGAERPQGGSSASATGALSLGTTSADLANTFWACQAGECGDLWRGKNGKWNSIDWGGNQHTGARRFVLSETESLRIVGKGLFVLDIALSTAELGDALSNNDKYGAISSAVDIGVSVGGVAGGNFGFSFALGYGFSSAFIAPWAAPRVADGMCYVSGNC